MTGSGRYRSDGKQLVVTRVAKGPDWVATAINNLEQWKLVCPETWMTNKRRSKDGLVSGAKCIITGLMFGFTSQKLRLPIPAPTALEGIMGVLGVWIGFKLAGRL